MAVCTLMMISLAAHVSSGCESCLIPIQGINRLGKAAPKPGSLRPPDPNRRQDLDLFSEGAESDADYMRMVHDVRPAWTAMLFCSLFLVTSPVHDYARLCAD